MENLDNSTCYARPKANVLQVSLSRCVSNDVAHVASVSLIGEAIIINTHILVDRTHPILARVWLLFSADRGTVIIRLVSDSYHKIIHHINAQFATEAIYSCFILIR